MDNSPSEEVNRAVTIWLLLTAALVFAMIVLGGYTRLSQSGLSMVDWKPLSRYLPPINQQDWTEEFRHYQAYPEYKILNSGMQLAEFKRIYLVEFFHRLLGRLLALIWVIPFLYFLSRRMIARKFLLPFLLVFAMGGGQGLLGWYMVQSGLVDDPRVSHLRLTGHFMLAIAIYSLLLWLAMDSHSNQSLRVLSGRGSPALMVLLVLLLVMLVSGALVAGSHAGHHFNTFPLMAGQWIPDNLFALSPWWVNLYHNTVTIQFSHRLLASVFFLLTLSIWLGRMRAGEGGNGGYHLLFALVSLQVILGIITLLLQVPISTAWAHQCNAVIMLSVLLRLIHRESHSESPAFQMPTS